jgi:hypothetical protein
MFMAVMREPGSAHVDDVGLTRTGHDGKIHSIRWNDVESVSVVVIPRRFHEADVLVSLRGRPGSGLAVHMPYDETPVDFLVQLQTLPGLDIEQLGALLQAKSIGTTKCWSRKE